MNTRIRTCLALTALATFATAQSTWTVGPTGQFPTIQAAITAAASGDTVEVAPGTYLETIDFLGKALAVVAVGPVAQGSHTIDAQGAGTVVWIALCGPGTLLQGFTITGGQGDPSGPMPGPGGIFIGYSEPAVRDCWIIGNVGRTPPSSSVTGGGDGGDGGIHIWVQLAQQVTIESCTFQNNQGGTGYAYYGGYAGQSTYPARGGAGAIGVRGNGYLGGWEVVSIHSCQFDANTGGPGASGWITGGFMGATYYPARDGAGAVSLVTSALDVRITESTFRDNVGAGIAAGAVDAEESPLYADPEYGVMAINGCVFTGNQNGAVRLNSKLATTLSRSLLHANAGTTIQRENATTTASLTVTDCALIGNSGGSAVAWTDIHRSVIFGHDAVGTGIFASGNPYDCVLWDNVGTPPGWGWHSCVEGGLGGPGNIAANPQFVRDPSPGPDMIWGTVDDDLGDLRLQPTSPCIDAGNPATTASGLDFGGHLRFLDGDLDGHQRIDMGAHEFGNVQLELTTPAPQQIQLDLLGDPSLFGVLAMGSPSTTPTPIAPWGDVFFDLASPLVIVTVGSLPATRTYNLPIAPIDVTFQALALGASGGNVSNPQQLQLP